MHHIRIRNKIIQSWQLKLNQVSPSARELHEKQSNFHVVWYWAGDRPRWDWRITQISLCVVQYNPGRVWGSTV